MNRAVSSVTGHCYQKVLKPVLFRCPPDAVHDTLIDRGVFLQRSELVRKFVSAIWAYDNPAILRQAVHGITFRNPVGLSAGFDKNFKLPPLLKSIGFGFMEGGSVTYHPCVGNPRPWFYRLPKTQSIVVYAGLGNEGVHRIVQRLRTYPGEVHTDFPLNISVAKTNSPGVCSDEQAIADYIGSLTILGKADLGDMYTLNISCPNTYGGEPFTTPERLDRLLRKVDQVVLAKPVFIKMPCDLPWREFDALLSVIVRHHIAGVTISNLAKDRGQATLMDSLPDSVKGNLSGKPTWELSNALIKATYQKYGKQLTIIGVGGIFSAEDAYTKIKLGATLVELITGMIFQGPQIIGQINQGIVGLLQRDGYRHISEAIGVDAGD